MTVMVSPRTPRRPKSPLLLALLVSAVPLGAHAQLGALAGAGAGPAVSRHDPVTFTADQVEYDRGTALVTARGHVEAWQDGRVLQADRIVFDRNTGVAAATGHVVLQDPNGQILYADYAELTKDMRDGILTGMSARLPQNARLAANGARRTDATINELSRVVYSSCDLCVTDPARPPLWQIHAAAAVQDLEHQKIEYRDVQLEMWGTPVAYTPYFWHPDPSVKRQSGLLAPSVGSSSSLGGFVSQPYYWVIDGQSDLTLTPIITTRAGPAFDAEYHQRFNNGYLMLNTSAGYMDNSVQGTIATRGQFAIDETWRMGFDINRASSAPYVRAFHVGAALVGDANLLPSQIYLEGFGVGAYSRLDSKFYQGLGGTIIAAQLPIVLPRYQYSYFGTPDALGGRLKVDAGAFNVYRSDGTGTRRASLSVEWSRPFTGPIGDLWKVTLHGDAAGYNASQFNEQPNFGPKPNIDAARALPQMAAEWRWPLARDAGAWGTQLIEPIVQVIVAPRSGDSQLQRYPNEDSLDFEFTDSNLFGFNRFPGIDRLEGGVRASAALHGAWYLGGTTFDGLVGQSYRTVPDNLFPAVTGLRDRVSDVVARATVSPTNWLDVTYRTRLDKRTGATRMAEAVTSVGVPKFRVGGGYIYSVYNPYSYYDNPAPPAANSPFFSSRNEATLTLSSDWGRYRFSGFVRRDLVRNQMVAYGADLIYEDECFIFDLKFAKRYVAYLSDPGATTVLFQITLKTIGQFGYRAL